MNQHKLNQVEVVLFYMDDPENKISGVLTGLKDAYSKIDPIKMLRMSVWSVSKHMPKANITLFTDFDTKVPDDIPKLKILRLDSIRHDFCDYDLYHARMNYIKEHFHSEKKTNFIFTDIDTLFAKDMALIFENDFDVAIPRTLYPDLKYSERGVPIGSLMSNINCGLFFVRTNSESIKFFDLWLKEFSYLADNDELIEYGSYKNKVKENFYKWWGGPHTLMVMFAKYLREKKDNINFHGTKILFVDDEVYNYAPDVINENNQLRIKILNEQFERTFMFHFRGSRKYFMELVAKKLGYN